MKKEEKQVIIDTLHRINSLVNLIEHKIGKM